MNIIIQLLFLMLPAYLANMAPVFAQRWKILEFMNFPVDMGKKWMGKRLLGDHKTFRGFFVAVCVGLLIAYFQYIIYAHEFFEDLALVNYSYWYLIGFLLGFGALFGDAVKSFFKRRFDVKPGEKFIPWDQIDYSVGALVFISFLVVLSWQQYLIAIVLSLILHILANMIGYYLKIRKSIF
jgi:CDP-2,3-bis-(O-geranylgeranyl)-sn-glycerol synthase